MKIRRTCASAAAVKPELCQTIGECLDRASSFLSSSLAPLLSSRSQREVLAAPSPADASCTPLSDSRALLSASAFRLASFCASSRMGFRKGGRARSTCTDNYNNHLCLGSPYVLTSIATAVPSSLTISYLATHTIHLPVPPANLRMSPFGLGFNPR